MPKNRSNEPDDWPHDENSRPENSRSDNARAPNRPRDRSQSARSAYDSDLYDRMEEGGGRDRDMGADSWGNASDRDTGRDRYNSRRDDDRYVGREGGSNQFSSWQNNPSDMQPRSSGNAPRGQYAGRGPKGYRRDDSRITEDVNEVLTVDSHIDASEIEVKVSNGEVTLRGTVDSRDAKQHAEDLAERVSGVNAVINQIKVSKSATANGDSEATPLERNNSDRS